MKCPCCGGAHLVRETRDIDHCYKGETTQLRNLTGDFCPVCGEGIFDTDQARQMMDQMSQFRRHVNASLVDPEFIAGVRNRLKLDQREAAAIFGGGVNAFSRYETGKSKPPVALVKLLRVLDRHPELLDEVRAT